MSYLPCDLSLKKKLNILLDSNSIEYRSFFSDQYSLSRDQRDIENDKYSFKFCEVDYLINRETAKIFDQIFYFFIDWRVCVDHNIFIKELDKKSKFLPNDPEIKKEFYKNEFQSQLMNYSLLNKEVDKNKWLHYLLENSIELIYDFEFEFLNLHDQKAFIKDYKRVKPSFDINLEPTKMEQEIDLFYDTFESFYIIERYFKTPKLAKLYEVEIIEKNISYLKSIIEAFKTKTKLNPTHRTLAIVHKYKQDAKCQGYEELTRKEMRNLGKKNRELAFDSFGYFGLTKNKNYKPIDKYDLDKVIPLLEDCPNAKRKAINDLENLNNS